MTQAQRMHELIMCPLQRCYPRDQLALPRRHWHGRFLSSKETIQLSMLDEAGRQRLITEIVTRMRARA